MRAICVFAALAILASAFAADEPLPAGVKPYPLKICVVSAEELGGMGKPVSKVYEGQEVKFCCKNCIKKFDKDPAGYVKKIAEQQGK
ncbi:MAG TPA: hypothetical protein VHX44_11550 [Planctomycetota bacterium]|nr:hypothetical protein [Planctomycetota bacterium]